MGKLKEAMINEHETDNYLTMARIMKKEWEAYQRKEVWARKYTGHAEIAIQNAFKAGFMAGFEGIYFRESEE